MERIGRYEIQRELGQGGMAMVYLARDPSFERQVAVKVLPRKLLQDPVFLTRFRREAKIIAALEHSYIVPVYDYGEEDAQAFIVMRYMTGGTLAGHISGVPMRLADVDPILNRVAEALDEAHNRDIIHRDLKPSNILFDGHGNAFLSDFGIAKLLQSTVNMTGSDVIGTPAYMSPEQARGDQQIDKHSDIYSLGVILYEMLSGQQPFKADTPWGLITKQISQPPPPVDAAALGLPEECNAILAQALAKDPHARYPTAGALANAVQALSLSATARASIPASPTVNLPAQRTLAPEPAHGARSASARTPEALRLPLPKPWIMGAAIGMLALAVPFGLALMLLLGLGRPRKPPATATLTATVSSSATPASSATTARTATAAILGTLISLTMVPSTAAVTSTPTPSDVPTATITTTPTHTLTPTRRSVTQPPRSTPTQPSTGTTTAAATPTPSCGPGQFFDPVMNTCRQLGGGGGATKTPIP